MYMPLDFFFVYQIFLSLLTVFPEVLLLPQSYECNGSPNCLKDGSGENPYTDEDGSGDYPYTGSVISDCPENWIKHGNSCFKIFNEPKLNWYEALNKCRSYSGGNLAKMDLANITETLKANENSFNQYWFGLNDFANESNFQWNDGSPLLPETEKWMDGEPNNAYGDEQCAEVLENGEWNDRSCTNKLAFLCQISRDIDECSSVNICHINGTCVNTYHSFVCVCNDGFSGDGINCAEIYSELGSSFNQNVYSSDGTNAREESGSGQLNDDSLELVEEESGSGLNYQDREREELELVSGLVCPEKWIKHRENCFKLFKQPQLNWYEALIECRRYPGGNLANVDDIAAIKKPLIHNGDYTSKYWIGLNDIVKESKFIWSDGTPFSSRKGKWLYGEPNNAFQDENCVEVIIGRMLNDKTCTNKQPFLCQRATSKAIDLYSESGSGFLQQNSESGSGFIEEIEEAGSRLKLGEKYEDVIELTDELNTATRLGHNQQIEDFFFKTLSSDDTGSNFYKLDTDAHTFEEPVQGALSTNMPKHDFFASKVIIGDSTTDLTTSDPTDLTTTTDPTTDFITIEFTSEDKSGTSFLFSNALDINSKLPVLSENEATSKSEENGNSATTVFESLSKHFKVENSATVPKIPDDKFSIKPSKMQLIVAYINKIALGISIVATALTFLSYIIFKKSRNTFSHKVLMNVCSAMLSILVLYIFGLKATSHQAGCMTIGFLLHYFLLVTLCWMSVEAFNIYLTFSKVANIDNTRFMIKSSIFAWVTPFIIATISILKNKETYISDNYCLTIDVLTPFGAFLLFNNILFILILKKIVCSKTMFGQYTSSISWSTNIQRFRQAVIMEILLVFTWVFGYFSIDGISLTFQCLFFVFNSLQGLFIIYCGLQRIVKEQRKNLFATRNFFTSTEEKRSLLEKVTPNILENPLDCQENEFSKPINLNY